MKIASDAYFRDGVTQLYNHGYFYSPEKQAVLHPYPTKWIPQ
jgi:hypothetical protein